jgi:hypothetical protein
MQAAKGVVSMTALQVKDIMMSYMEQKYNETFTFVNIGTQLWDRSYIEMFVAADKMPGKNICVHMNKKKDKFGNRVFEDDYIFYLRQQELSDYISELAESIYGPNKVLSSVDLLPGTAAPEMPIEELVRHIRGGGIFRLYTAKKNSDRNENIERFRKALAAKQCEISMWVTYVKDAAVLEELNEELTYSHEWSNWKKGKFVCQTNFAILDGQFFREIEWRDLSNDQ